MFTKDCQMIDNKKKKLAQSVECWKIPSWERNISEHDIQNTQTTTEKCFFVYHKLG